MPVENFEVGVVGFGRVWPTIEAGLQNAGFGLG